MSPARSAYRPFAVAAAVLLAVVVADPRPGRVPGSRHVHDAARRSGLAATDRRRPGPPDRHVPPGHDARRALVDGAARRGARQSTTLPNTRSVALQAPTGHGEDVAREPPRRPARPARQRRPSPLPRRRPDRGAALGRAVGPREHGPGDLQRRSRDRRLARCRHRRPPGARHHDRRPGDGRRGHR